MTYAVWIKVEHSMGRPGERNEAWWAGPGEFATRREAVTWVEDFIRESNNDGEFERYDDDWTDEDDEEEARA